MERMITKKRIYLIFVFLIVPVTVLLMQFMGCKKAALVAPENATLLLSVNPSVISLGGQAVVKVVGYKASGTPLPDGTLIYFTCDIGSIESSKEIKNGIAEALFRSSDNRSGVATISASSGNAVPIPETISVTIGSSALFSLSLSADPPTLPVSGGATTIRVTAYDENLNPLGNIPVILTTDSGQLNSKGNAIVTDNSGTAEDVLITTATALVTASSGEIAAEITVNVATNETPTASFVYSPTNPKIDEKVYFNASGSTDEDGTIVSYGWDFGDGRRASGKTTNHRYKVTGTFTVVLTVTDDTGNSASASQTITVSQGGFPTASFVYSPTNPVVGETVYFNASNSSDPDGHIESYAWDFGDGNTASGQTVTHKFPDNGSYKVLLVVTDNDGNSGSSDQTVPVGNNEKPVAQFAYSPQSPRVDETVNFDASQSYDPDGSIVSFEWNYGDGSTGSGSSVSHKFSQKGEYTVSLKVTDNSGNTDTASTEIQVTGGQEPTAKFVFSPAQPVTGEPVYFNATESADPDGSIVSWQWDFGDGSSGSGEKTTHTYTEEGTYTVLLTVTDNDGNEDSYQANVTVTNGSPPTAAFTVSPPGPSLTDTITFSATTSYDPDGTIISWQWDFGDSNTSSGEIVTHSYAASGTYTVVLVVTDDKGNRSEAQKTITVTP